MMMNSRFPTIADLLVLAVIVIWIRSNSKDGIHTEVENFNELLTTNRQLTQAPNHHQPLMLLPRYEDIVDPSQFTYDDFLRAIPEKMILSEKEYDLRKAIFNKHWLKIQQHNHNYLLNSMYQYRVGLNEFMDRFPEELPSRGYDKASSRHWNINPIDDSVITVSDAVVKQEEKESSSTEDLANEEDASSLDVSQIAGRRELNYWITIEPHFHDHNNHTLPKSVDWRFSAQTGTPLATPVKAQGHCGSCWAFATAAALETHIAIHQNQTTLVELSMQELVSCVPNPNHCGGSGGCGGSTAELALDFIAVRGLVDEWHFGYQSYGGKPHGRVKCNLKTQPFETETTTNNQQPVSQFYQDAVATVEGYVRLPSNNYTALMHAVAKFGPVIVNVASDPWTNYESGVFSAHGHTTANTDINHVVVLMGYGNDETTGEDYWLVRNSYGPQWGEEGYIRLKRVDPQSLPSADADCGMDVTPAHGIACTEGGDDHSHRHHHITPPAVKVCGTSGILFDPVLPYGVHLLHK